MTTQSVDRAIVQFMPDVASELDFFGSHKQVADSIAAAIEQNPKLKVIGVLGPWGSGKSTVMGLVEQALAQTTKTFHVFTYDAWLHQSDPPRRSFLEQFLSFLINKDLVASESWKEPMDRLNRRVEDTDTTTTPHLTTAGHWLLMSLALVPIGSRFLGADWYARMIDSTSSGLQRAVFPFGLTLALAPLLVAFGFYWAWRPVRHPFRRDLSSFLSSANFRQHRPPYDKSSLLALMVNKQVQVVSNRVIKTPEPTTIEFQCVFRDMLAAAQLNDSRMVIVIDNLDRLPESAAIEMWTTIRSFFLGAIEGMHFSDDTLMPCVLLPIDDHAVERLYRSSEHDNVSLAKSFMDKTFDLTFHVNGPVLSDWTAYLKLLLAKVFGESLADEWSIETARLYAKKRKGRVTPRDLVRQVNSIGVLWLQWRQQNIPFMTIAYYAVFREDLDKDLLAGINSPHVDLSEHDSNWMRNLAALHFGVNPEHALQVMLMPNLEEAIQSKSLLAFERQLAIPGVGSILVEMVTRTEPDFQFLSNLAALLDQTQPSSLGELPSMWRKMRRAYLAADLHETLNVEDAALPIALIKFGASEEREEVVKAIGDKIGRFKPSRVRPSDTNGVLEKLIVPWHKAASNLPTPPIIEIENADLYLRLAPEIMDGDHLSTLVHSHVDSNALAASLAMALPTMAPGVATKQVRVVLAHSLEERGVTALLEAAGTILDDTESTNAKINVAVHLLGSLRLSHPLGASRAKNFADTGELRTLVDRAYAGWDVQLAARLTALMILETQPLTIPDGGWPKYLKQYDRFAEFVDEALLKYGDSRFLERLTYQYSKDENTEYLLRKLVSRRIKANDLGEFSVEDVITQTEPYWEIVFLEEEAEFYGLVLQEDADWELLERQPLTLHTIRILNPLIALTSEERKRRFRTVFRKMIGLVPATRWKNEVETSDDLIDLVSSFKAKETRYAVGTPLYDALQGLLPQLTDNQVPPFAERWFKAVQLLSAAGRKTVLANLRDRLNLMTELPNLLAILKVGGTLLLEQGGFEGRADESVRHVLAPLLNDNEGILWLSVHAEYLQKWTSRSTRATQRFIAEQVQERRQGAEDTVRALLDGIAKSLRLATI